MVWLDIVHIAEQHFELLNSDFAVLVGVQQVEVVVYGLVYVILVLSLHL